MFDLDGLQEIWVTIKRNKVRSILTGFGVFWGLLMLILLLGMGSSFKGGMQTVTDGFATNSCIIYSDRTSEAYKGFKVGRWWNINNRDVQIIRDKCRNVEYMSPLLWSRWNNRTILRGQKKGDYRYVGIYPEYFNIESVILRQGRLLNDVDMRDKRKVCLIGKEVHETLFDVDEDPVGELIRIGGTYFQVVGVISQRSMSSMVGHIDGMILMPFSTMQYIFNRGDIVHQLTVTARHGVPVSVLEEQVKAILRENHDISPTDEKAVGGFNVEEQFMRFTALFRGVDILIWIVGLGALFSGVIGISNIMLVTVRERMREIGVRRAIGATPAQILIQILMESLVLTAVAGMCGFMLGILMLAGVQSAMEGAEGGLFAPPLISFSLALVAMAIMMASGVVAGFLPAMKALKVKAIDAIRDE